MPTRKVGRHGALILPDYVGQRNSRNIISSVRHCGLVESARTWDGSGCEFDSWQCQQYLCS